MEPPRAVVPIDIAWHAEGTHVLEIILCKDRLGRFSERARAAAEDGLVARLEVQLVDLDVCGRDDVAQYRAIEPAPPHTAISRYFRGIGLPRAEALGDNYDNALEAIKRYMATPYDPKESKTTAVK